jgi:N-acetylglucosaminyldiphosphoundecaprenol N-acetyl-beta-D-mannosaminyltransferase
MPERRTLLGLRVDDWTMAELVYYLHECIIHRIPVHLWGINIPLFAMVRSVPELFAFSQDFDIVVADGAGIPIFGRFMGQRIRAHVGTPHVAEEMIKLAARQGYRVLLLGATPKVNTEAARKLLDKYPSLKLCPGIDGYYPLTAEADIAKRIRDLHPDILLVGMSVPKKEKFLLKWKNFMQVPVGIACGGYFDVLAGKTSLAPKVIERLAMSWLWRFMLEPRRLFSKMLMGGLLFIFYIFPVSIFSHIFLPNHSLNIFNLFPSARIERETMR